MPTTLLEGSSGDEVKKWQRIIGVDDDGFFGPDTVAATKAWQRAHKLVDDGKVGSATWSAALGTTPPKQKEKTPQAPADNEAYAIAKRAMPDMPERERQYVLTVARGEGFYGRGWSKPPTGKALDDALRLGITGTEGAGSNNWGAVQGTGSAGSFPHVDYHANGEPYLGHFKRYKTPEEGFLDMAHIILNGGKRGAEGAAIIVKAINKGSLRKAVFAQHDNGYFELAPEKYLSAVMNNYNVLTTNNDWKRLMSENGGVLGTIIGLLGFASAVVLGYNLLKKG